MKVYLARVDGYMSGWLTKAGSDWGPENTLTDDVMKATRYDSPNWAMQDLYHGGWSKIHGLKTGVVKATISITVEGKDYE